MDLLHRFFQLHRLLDGRRTPLPRREIEAALGCSPSTVKRLVGQLRNYGAPIEAVPGQGYRYRGGRCAVMPGLQFSAGELSALLLAHQLLGELGRGAGAAPLAELRQGLESTLAGAGLAAAGLAGRLRIKPSRSRGEPPCLPVVMQALLARRCLSIRYRGRSDTASERKIAPQRLTRYRDRWYLDAFCHLRRDLRSFALERIHDAALEDAPCEEVSMEVLNIWSDAAYGIFNGPGRHLAVLRFSPGRARWAAAECWHPRSSGRGLPDGSFELCVPYSDPTELMADVMRLGDEVEVLAPPALREAVGEALRRAARQYPLPGQA